MGQDQVSGGVSVLCWLAAPVGNVSMETSKIFEGWDPENGSTTVV